MARLVFRCDGDDRIGAGHVARCIEIARVLHAGGVEVAIVGRLAGVSAELATGSGLPVLAPDPAAPAGVPASADAAVVDSYEIDADELAAAAGLRPVCAIVDEPPVPAVPVVLSYHLDAPERLAVPPGTIGILGPAYAPIRPSAVAARRQRALSRALVTLGGSRAGVELAGALVDALLALDSQLEVFAATSAALEPRPRLASGIVPGGLMREIVAADVAISGSGSTPYELACAGVPSLLVALADNQLPVGRAFAGAGVADFADGRAGLSRGQAAEALAGLGDPDHRRRLAAAGPAAFDGYGAFRAAAAIQAALAGRPLPRVIRYRPATQDDADRLRAWRNDPDTRSGSRDQALVGADAHAAWLERTLADHSRTLLIAVRDGTPCGTVRFDRDGSETEIAVTVAPDARGDGVGAQIIREATQLYLAAHEDVHAVNAEIRSSNRGSLAAFERAGYARRGSGGEYELYEARFEAVSAAGRG